MKTAVIADVVGTIVGGPDRIILTPRTIDSVRGVQVDDILFAERADTIPYPQAAHIYEVLLPALAGERVDHLHRRLHRWLDRVPFAPTPAPLPSELDDATTEGPANAYPADAGEFAARWNRMTPEQRERFNEILIRNSVDAAKCVLQNHQGLAAEIIDLHAEHEEALQQLAESRARYGDLEARIVEPILNTAELDDWDTWIESDDARSGDHPFTVHVYGPDDVFPARTWQEATQAAHAINQAMTAYARDVHDPTAHGWATPYTTAHAREIGLVSR